MTDKTPLVSIITVNYNSSEETLAFIESLYKSEYTNWELFVVDNASKQSPKDEILSKYPNVNVLESENNLGFAGGNNLALDHCKGSLIFFVNNDTILPKETLGKLVDTIGKVDQPGAVSPKFEYYHSRGETEYAGSTKINPFTARNKRVGFLQPPENFTGVIETFYVHGGAMLIPTSVIEAVGPMADDFFLYYEEMDWSERIRKGGFKIYCDRDALIYHKESASVGQLNPMKTYYLNRNRILFMRRNYKGLQLLPFMLFFSLVSFPKNILTYAAKGNFKHLKAFYKGVSFHFGSGDSDYQP